MEGQLSSIYSSTPMDLLSHFKRPLVNEMSPSAQYGGKELCQTSGKLKFVA